VSLRGNVFLYQGEELGLPQAQIAFADLKDPEAIANWPQTLGRDGARTPMPWAAHNPGAGFSTVDPWLPIPATHVALAVQTQEHDPQSLLMLTRRLVALRNTSAALRVGAIRIIEAGDSILGFERTAVREQLLCVFNLGETPQTFSAPLPGKWRVLEAVGGATPWTLPPWSGLLAMHVNGSHPAA
jgi:alpha-glucosidase